MTNGIRHEEPTRQKPAIKKPKPKKGAAISKQKRGVVATPDQ